MYGARTPLCFFILPAASSDGVPWVKVRLELRLSYFLDSEAAMISIKQVLSGLMGGFLLGEVSRIVAATVRVINPHVPLVLMRPAAIFNWVRQDRSRRERLR
jgi:hypothetical protein